MLLGHWGQLENARNTINIVWSEDKLERVIRTSIVFEKNKPKLLIRIDRLVVNIKDTFFLYLWFSYTPRDSVFTFKHNVHFIYILHAWYTGITLFLNQTCP